MMFSQLGPLFQNQFRQAESSDTRQEIRRDEKREHHKKEDPEKRPNDQDLWQDSTTVSVDSLRVFLINFLESLEKEAQKNQNQNTENPVQYTAPAKEDTKQPQNTMTSRAVQAYASMSEYSKTPPKRQEQRKPPAKEKVSTPEIRTMYTLIQDLEDLERKGLRDVTILKADTFLESLALAINKAKKQF